MSSIKNDCESGGYDISIFSVSPSQDFICPLCLNVLRNPKQFCSGGHCICHSCLVDYLKHSNLCPICKECVPTPTLANNLYLKGAIENLDTFCVTADHLKPHSSEPSKCCSWVGKLHLRDAHYAKDCEYVLMNCTTKRCREQIPRKFLEDHITNECRYVNIPCLNVGCTYKPPRKKLREHMLACQYQFIKCENVGCDQNVHKRVFERHKSQCRFNLLFLVQRGQHSMHRDVLRNTGNESKQLYSSSLSTVGDVASPAFSNNLDTLTSLTPPHSNKEAAPNVSQQQSVKNSSPHETVYQYMWSLLWKSFLFMLWLIWQLLVFLGTANINSLSPYLWTLIGVCVVVSIIPLGWWRGIFITLIVTLCTSLFTMIMTYNRYKKSFESTIPSNANKNRHKVKTQRNFSNS